MRTAVLTLSLLTACSQADAPKADTEATQLVYGVDDRSDVYEIVSPSQLALADGTVALMDGSALSRAPGNNGWDVYVGFDLTDSQSVCPTEPFADQPTTAFCSGFFVGDDLVVTAGHCVSSATCSGTRFVFGYEMADANTVVDRVDDDDVYSCDSIVGRQLAGSEDWAVVRVDRPITGHTPMPIRRSGTVPLGTDLVLLGHPAGLPLKIAPGGEVQSNSNAFYFDADVDAYGGNSGSPVVNAATGEVEGILVRGNADWSWTGSCYVSNQCPESGCPGWEDVTRTTLFDHLVPDLGVSGADVCDDDNDSESEAEALTAGAYDNLQICLGDDDWYAIDVPAGGNLTVDISFLNSEGDLDMELRFGGNQIDLSQSVSNGETVEVLDAAGGTYFVRVYGYAGAAAAYDLDVAIDAPPPPMTIATPVPPAGGQIASWVIDDGVPNSTVHVVLGEPGSTAVPGCPGLFVDIDAPIVAGTVATDAAGDGTLTVTVPTFATGQTRTFYGVDLANCAVTPALDVTFQ
jgi:V8-like Glu-specific endopeptidase